MIYSVNLIAAKGLAKKVKELKIIKFKTQNALLVLTEDVKNPELKSWRKRTAASKGHIESPCYCPVNYLPSINYLVRLGIFTKSRTTYRVQYTVNKVKLERYLNSL